MTERIRLLIQAYLSGQISEAQWTQHLAADDALREAWARIEAERRGK